MQKELDVAEQDQGDSELLERAKKRYKSCESGWSKIYQSARQDMRFLSDDPYSQWEPEELAARRKISAPCLQFDNLSQFIHQVVNDARANTPSIEIIPVGSGAEKEVADQLSDRIRAIEYQSNADTAYDRAMTCAVKYSVGFVAVDYRAPTEGGEPDIFIDSVVDPLSVYIDPDSTAGDGADATFGFMCYKISLAQFKAKYPDADPVDFEAGSAAILSAAEDEDNAKVLLVKYYEKKDEGGRAIIHQTICSGADVLERGILPGKYIPLIPFYGEESWIEGVREIKSLIRSAKTPSRMYNLFKSVECDLLLKQPIAPIIAQSGTLAGYEEGYKNPGSTDVLLYNSTNSEGAPASAPARLAPPPIPMGFVNASRDAAESIKSSLGMYNASIGQRSNETSGKAINARKMEGDVANYHFNDNTMRGIAHVGKVVVCAILDIYRDGREIFTINKERRPSTVGINGVRTKSQERDYFLGRGNYDVRVITGPSYTTQRQEAAQFYAETVRAMPDLMPIIGDLVFKFQDSPGADVISERIRKTIDPKFLEGEEREGEEAVNHEAMQIKQEAQMMMERAQAEMQAAQQRIMELENELQTQKSDKVISAAELQIKHQELQVKQQELQLKTMEAQARMEQGAVKDSGAAEDIKLREVKLKEAQFALDAIAKQVDMMIQLQKGGDSSASVSVERESGPEEGQVEFELEANKVAAQEQYNEILLKGMLSIESMLARMNDQMSQPIAIIRDENNMIIGAQ